MGRKKPPKDEPIDPAKRTTLKLGGALGVAAATGNIAPVTAAVSSALDMAAATRVATTLKKAMPMANFVDLMSGLAHDITRASARLPDLFDHGRLAELQLTPQERMNDAFGDLDHVEQSYRKLRTFLKAHPEFAALSLDDLKKNEGVMAIRAAVFHAEHHDGEDVDDLKMGDLLESDTFSDALKNIHGAFGDNVGEALLAHAKQRAEAMAAQVWQIVQETPGNVRYLALEGPNNRSGAFRILKPFLPKSAGLKAFQDAVEREARIHERLYELRYTEQFGAQAKAVLKRMESDPQTSIDDILRDAKLDTKTIEAIEQPIGTAPEGRTLNYGERIELERNQEFAPKLTSVLNGVVEVHADGVDLKRRPCYRLEFIDPTLQDSAVMDTVLNQLYIALNPSYEPDEGHVGSTPLWDEAEMHVQRYPNKGMCRISFGRAMDSEIMDHYLQHFSKLPATISEADIAKIDMGEVRRIARSAGAEIMKNLEVLETQAKALAESNPQTYPSINDAMQALVTMKDEGEQHASPVTIADEAANKIVVEGLKKLTPNIPIMSEEDVSDEGISDNLRKAMDGGTYWTVDPLDGTKTAIAWASGEKTHTGFGVHIGLVQNGEPVLGAVYFPAEGALYYTEGGKAYKEVDGEEGRRKLTIKKFSGDAPINVSASHNVALRPTELAGHATEHDPAVGGGRIIAAAAGKVDVGFIDREFSYWDVAAAHAILRAAGGDMCQLPPTPTEDTAALLNAAASADALKEGKPVRYDNALRDAKGVPYVPPCVAASNATLHTLGASEAAFPRAGRKIA